ncbi:MAG TPA: IS66 family transposase zinc-finger binding domain-containing protein, partial [Agitococcus sp.]|nr:IS66 family transposase zinc-finger binding domain-containing protein [Agitococcus sp.]
MNSEQNIDTLLSLLKQSQEENKALRQTLQSMQSQLDKLQRMLFGQSSERRPLDKKKPHATDIAQAATATAKNPPSSQEKKANGRRQLPDTLPRKIIKHELVGDGLVCTCCQSTLHMVGKDISEQLEFIPAELYVIEHRRYK